jgi:hypothetical protein
MKKLVAAAALALFLPVETTAQPTACEPLVMVGAAAGLLRGDIPVDPEPAGGGRFGLAAATGVGFEGSVHASFPIARTWSLLTEFGTGTRDVLLERDASGTYVQRKTGDEIALRRLNVGLVRNRVGRLACTYASIRGGLYWFGYQGVTLVAPGGAGLLGLEVSVSEMGTVFFEVELYAAITKARPPVTPASAVANIRPAFGFRYRF